MKSATCIADEPDQQALRALLDSMPQPAWITEHDGTTIWHNQPWYRYTGAHPPRNHADSWRQVCAPLAALTARWDHARLNGQPYEMEVPIRSAAGEFRWFLPVPSLSCSATARYCAGWALARMWTSYAACGPKRPAMPASRTSCSPLCHTSCARRSAILGWAQVLRRGGRDAADLQRGLQTIERNARLQAAHRRSARHEQPVRRPPAIAAAQHGRAAAGRCLGTAADAASASAIELELAPCADQLMVLGDSERLQQLLGKLLHNAIKFSTPACACACMQGTKAALSASASTTRV
jgi:hypothetical protein